MIEKTGEEVDLTTQEENVDLDTTNTDESSEDADFDWKAEAEKQKQIAENQKIRAEKAEEKAKEKKEVKQPIRKEGELSTMDIIALSKANIDQEDMPEVVEYAKFKGISITEALKSPIMKAAIQEKSEMRQSATASNTGGARRSSGKVSDETLLSNASKGILPESDEDMDRLVKAKMSKKK